MSQTADLKILRRDDLIPPSVSLKYRVAIKVGNTTVVQVIHDIAASISGTVVEGVGQVGVLQSLAQLVAGSGTIAGGTQTTLQAYARRPGAPAITLDLEGPTITQQPLTSLALPVTAGVLNAPGSDAGFWTNLFPDLATQSGVGFYDPTNCPPTVVQKGTTTPVDLTVYQYMITGGGVASWMQTGGGAAGLVQLSTVSASFSYLDTDKSPGTTTPNLKTATTGSQPKTADVLLTNLPTGIYQTATPGEVIPYGLAGFIYNIEKIPQYQGSFTIQEQDITDQCPMGNNLNLTGSLAEWAAMNATVQEIEYDLEAGRTTLTFGPAAHLGAQDFIERLRANRGPRWYYLNGANATNTANANANATNTAFKDGNNSSKIHTQITFPTDLVTQHGATPLAIPAGVSVNGVLGATGAVAPAAPSLLVHAGGALDTASNWFLMSIADLGSSNKQMRVREMQICYSTDGGETWLNGYMLVLGSKPYATSTGIDLTP